MRSFRKSSRKFLPALLIAFAASLTAAVRAATFPATDEAVFSPMQEEMARSLKNLKEGDFGPPYFIAYRMVVGRGMDISASFGGVVSENKYHSQTLFSEVRYGNKKMDNTSIQYQGLSAEAPLSGKELRENLWILTDKAYKDAVAGYLEKKAKRVTEFRAENLPDFTDEPSTRSYEPQEAPSFDDAAARSLVKNLSRLLRSYPYIYHGTVILHLGWSRRYLLTSEGTKVSGPYENLPNYLSIDVNSRAKDGLKVSNYREWVFKDMKSLPPREKLARAVKRLALELKELRDAPLETPVAAPTILDPEMTGVLFHEALGHKLEGERQRDPLQGQIFKGMVGKKIIPSFLSVIDDPTMSFFKGVSLHGHYRIDSEGVPSERVVLVRNGILENFLMSRWPLKDFSHSNGHGRASSRLRPLGRMANLMIEAKNPLSPAALKNKLLKLLRSEHKPYGFRIVGAYGGDNPSERTQAQTLQLRPRLVYRISAKDGKETLVRGVKIVVTPLVVLNRILAASNDEALSNPYFCGAESGWAPVDQIAPSVLVSELEFERLPENRLKPPILPSPLTHLLKHGEDAWPPALIAPSPLTHGKN